MPGWHICGGVAVILTGLALAQQSPAGGKASESKQSSPASTQPDVKDVLESKVKAEWDAFKNRDKKAYGDLLSDDFVAVEDDGDGARNKIQAMNEVPASNIRNYTLAFFKFIPLAPEAAYVTYEITMEFPLKAAARYKRVLITEIWIKRDGQWRARHYQETRVK
jgi:ketosteroid isomerase-like protein